MSSLQNLGNNIVTNISSEKTLWYIVETIWRKLSAISTLSLAQKFLPEFNHLHIVKMYRYAGKGAYIETAKLVSLSSYNVMLTHFLCILQSFNKTVQNISSHFP